MTIAPYWKGNPHAELCLTYADYVCGSDSFLRLPAAGLRTQFRLANLARIFINLNWYDNIVILCMILND